MTHLSKLVLVHDSSEVSAARRAAAQCAASWRLSETAIGKAALVATELATNLVKHGGGGSILIGTDPGRDGCITLVSIDKGRGIGNVAAAMSDGYSTAGSPGTGLGAIRRAAAVFDLYAFPDRGTAVLARIEDEAPRQPAFTTPSPIAAGGVCVALAGEEYSGDAWTAVESPNGITIGVADGLGHGIAASDASAAAVRSFSAPGERTLEQMLQDAHGPLRATRGAAVGIARIHHAQGRLDFAGVGNIAGTIIAEEATRRVVSLNGIVGHEMRRVQSFSYPWTPASVLILQSDGISSSWNAANYPGLLQHHPALIAAVLYRDHCRGNDDATVVVAKAS